MQEHENGLFFDFNKALLEDFEIRSSEIRVEVSEFAILSGYEGVDTYTRYPRYILIYEDVTYSKRMISEYVDEKRQEFGKRHEIIDSDFAPSQKTMYLHFVDMVSRKMNAYIGWEIIAAAVRVETTI